MRELKNRDWKKIRKYISDSEVKRYLIGRKHEQEKNKELLLMVSRQDKPIQAIEQS